MSAIISRSIVCSLVVTAICLLCAACGAPGEDDSATAADTASTLDIFVNFDTTGAALDTSSVGTSDAAPVEDTEMPDVTPGDGAPAAGTLEAKCSSNEECTSGYCVPGPAGKVCSRLCIDSCPTGYICAQLMGTVDLIYLCLPRWLHLCDPCASDATCADSSPGGSARCLDYGGTGKFCGSACKSDGECPQGFACVAEPGDDVGQCRKVSGVCQCSPMAIEDKLATECSHASPYGVCEGLRGCGADGLSACSAPVPTAEICNGLDDDCDGSTDAGIAVAPCINSSALGVCTGQTACVAGKVTCSGPIPAKESCNGKDDDCDGQIDENACDDGNPCTEDACDLSLGGCLFAQVSKPCNDSDVCTTDDVCSAGKCQGAPVNCDDGDGCTLDTCDAKASQPGCQHAPDPGAACDDADPCTGDDVCMPKGATLTCSGTGLADGAACKDGSPCTIKAACLAGKCKPSATACDDGNPCTDDTCDAAGNGACKHFYNIAACDDNNACTIGDACFAGKCVGLGKTNCDDQDPCTSDACDAKLGGCANTPKTGGSCTDGNLCTTGDACTVVDGKAVCAGTGLKCDDGKACTSDACNPAFGCEYVFVSGPCDDGDKCTSKDHCQAGQCTPGEYSCGECQSNADCKSKEDGNLCNGTMICEKQGHTCVVDPSTVVKCAAPGGGAGVCLKAICDAKTAKCVYTGANDGKSCDDSNACTNKDLCKAGACMGQYGAVACDDANPCTQDLCDPSAGCKTLALDGVGCVDGNSCTQNDTCAKGKCVPGVALGCNDGNPCTTDGCDASKGCIHNVNTLPCDDGNVCTTGDLCLNAVCTPKAALNCDDSNICTADFCNAKTGCGHSPANGIQCNDSNACTAADKCTAGQCVGGGQLPCSDGNICTNDGCDPKSGCTFAANTAKCNDGNGCTDNDACQGGGCKSGKPSDCNDANTCTVDLCDPAKGCMYQKVVDGTPCNDGDACTVSDKCKSAICLAGKKLGCNDNQVCTTDSCDPKTGCVYKPLADGDPCDDKSPCTLVDACAKGKCTGTGTKDLDKDGFIDSKCPNGDDCDDTSDKAHPGLKEVCDDLDNDCKAGVDDGCDDDNDGYCDIKMTIPKGVVPKTCTKLGGDCNDKNAAINPGAVEKLELDLDYVGRGSQYYSFTTNGPLGLAAAPDGALWMAYRRVRNGISPSEGLYLAGRAANSTQWTFYQLPVKMVPKGQALAVDADGTPHLLYHSGKQLYHATLDPEKGWTIENAILETNVPSHLSLVVRKVAGGVDAHAAWYDGTLGDLRYARRSGGKWASAATVDSANDVGQFASIGVDSAGAVHIAYLDSTKHDLRYATDAGAPGKFVATTLDGAGAAAGFSAALAIDGSDKVHIGHYELLGSDLRYTAKSNGQWKTEIVDEKGTVGQQVAIAVGTDGVVHFSYRDDDASRIKHAWGKAGAWSVESINSSGFTNVATSQRAPIAVVGTVPSVFWPFDVAKSYAWLKVATRSPGWQTVYVDEHFGNNGNYNQHAARSHGSFSDGDISVLGGSTYGHLQVGRWLGKGFAWRGYRDKVTNQPLNLWPGGFDKDPGGVIHACGSAKRTNGGYGGGIRYVSGTWAGGFTGQTIDPASKAGLPCRVAVDSASLVHIVYYDSGNQVMRYRTVKNGVAGAGEVPDASFGSGSVLDIVSPGAGETIAAYGGGSLRVATRTTNKPWSAQILAGTSPGQIALAQLPNGDTALITGTYVKNLQIRMRKGGVWSAPTTMAPKASSWSSRALAATVDSGGAIHVASASTSYLVHLTNKFGGWSAVYMPGARFRGQTRTVDILTKADGRVLVAGTSASSEWGDLEATFTYKNLVDDNCDGN